MWLAVLLPDELDGDGGTGRGLELGDEPDRMARLGSGQQQAGVDLTGLGVGGQDRLVFLGPFQAEQVFQGPFAEHDLRPEDQRR